MNVTKFLDDIHKVVPVTLVKHFHFLDISSDLCSSVWRQITHKCIRIKLLLCVMCVASFIECLRAVNKYGICFQTEKQVTNLAPLAKIYFFLSIFLLLLFIPWDVHLIHLMYVHVHSFEHYFHADFLLF